MTLPAKQPEKKEPAKQPEKKEPAKKETPKEEVLDFDTLYKKTVKELLVFAKENGIEIPPRTKKAEIVQMIVYQMQNKKGGSKK